MNLLKTRCQFRSLRCFRVFCLELIRNIPGYLEDAYRTTGTVHIIAISGFNIALITGLVIRLFRRIFKPVWAGILAISAILFYTLLVGAEPSVVRAAIMGSLSIPAYYIGRRIIGINSLTFAAAVMLLLNPLLLWDLGFQLSYLATLGLMVLADPVLKSLSDLDGGALYRKCNPNRHALLCADCFHTLRAVCGITGCAWV